MAKANKNNIAAYTDGVFWYNCVQYAPFKQAKGVCPGQKYLYVEKMAVQTAPCRNTTYYNTQYTVDIMSQNLNKDSGYHESYFSDHLCAELSPLTLFVSQQLWRSLHRAR